MTGTIRTFAQLFAAVILLLSLSVPGVAGTISDLDVKASQGTAGSISTVWCRATLESNDSEQTDTGSLVLRFPQGFLLSRSSIQVSFAGGSSAVKLVGYEVAGRQLTLELAIDNHELDVASSTLQVEFRIDGVVNSGRAGEYLMEAVMVDRSGAVLSDPAASDLLMVSPAAASAIRILPTGEIDLRAGESAMFSAVVEDEFGNVITDVPVSWDLEACISCIGQVYDSTLLATTVGTGRVVATAAGMTAQSGEIHVSAGPLAAMDLAVADTQVVENVLVSPSTVTLRDQFGNPVTDFDIVANPITLDVSSGSVSPLTISDSSAVVDSLVDLTAVGVVFAGNSGLVDIRASTGSVFSNTDGAWFNKYEILGLLSDYNTPFIQVVSGYPGVVRVVIRNDGNMTASEDISISAKFLATGDSSSVSVAPGLPGVTDTVDIELPVHDDTPVSDTLAVSVKAEFEVGGVQFQTVDSVRSEIEVVEPNLVYLMPGTLRPDTILVDLPFDITFDVDAGTFTGPVDSSLVRVRLLDSPDGQALATVYQGRAQTPGIVSGVVSYNGMEGVFEDVVLTSDTWVYADVFLELHSERTVYILEQLQAESLYVYDGIDLYYDTSSFRPTVVYAGAESEFFFEVAVDESMALPFLPGNSIFTLRGSGFSTTTNLALEGDSLVPGLNSLRSYGIFVPQDLVGSILLAEASFRYTIPGIPDTLRFTTDFGLTGFPIQVVRSPILQVLEVSVIAPNTPNVNTGQLIQVSASIINHTETTIDSVSVRMTTDGESDFVPEEIIRGFPGYDTVTVVFDVQVSDFSGNIEIFTISTSAPQVEIWPPIDNSAFIDIQLPAHLDLSYRLFGAVNNTVTYGKNFDLNVLLDNSGGSNVSDGAYRLVVAGVDQAGPDTLSGALVAEEPVDFVFMAPTYDTVITFEFTVIDTPIDLNENEPASIGASSFTFDISVVSSEAELLVTATPSGNNRVLPGRQQAVFSLEMYNSGVADFSTIAIDQILVETNTASGNPLEARDIINLGNTGFYEGDTLVSLVSAGNSKILFTLDSLVIGPQQTRTITLRMEMRATSQHTVVLEVPPDGITAFFTSGPNAGQPPTIESGSDDPEFITEALAIVGPDLKSSFMIENNPFDPNDGPVEFSYELTVDTDMEFRVLTLIGEEVYSSSIASGGPGGRAGSNQVTWDGRNNAGRMVLNGVYIACLTNADTEEESRIKIAVVKR